MTPKDITPQQIDQAIAAYDSDEGAVLAREEARYIVEQLNESPSAIDVMGATILYATQRGMTLANVLRDSLACGIQMGMWIAANAPKEIEITAELSKLMSDDEFEQLRKEIANVKSNNDR